MRCTKIVFDSYSATYICTKGAVLKEISLSDQTNNALSFSNYWLKLVFPPLGGVCVKTTAENNCFQRGIVNWRMLWEVASPPSVGHRQNSSHCLYKEYQVGCSMLFRILKGTYDEKGKKKQQQLFLVLDHCI